MKNAIRKLRETGGLTQEELARKAGVTRQTVISLEKGRYNPSLELAFRLSRIFQRPIEDIFETEEL